MAGFREFAAGEPLTSANVDDFLAKQAVMKFADAAARDLALGTAVVSPNALREGMVAWLDDTDSVIAYDGSAWNPVGAEPPAGIGSNVVQTVKTDAFSTPSTSFVDVSGVTLTITPTAATSKVLVIVTGITSNSGASSNAFQLVRNSTNIAVAIGGTTQETQRIFTGAANETAAFAISFVDSPATTSATDYKLRMRVSSNTGFVGRLSGFDERSITSITAIEVQA